MENEGEKKEREERNIRENRYGHVDDGRVGGRGSGGGWGGRERNYTAISVPTIQRKRNYGINGGVRRGVIKNDT